MAENLLLRWPKAQRNSKKSIDTELLAQKYFFRTYGKV
jgi:hypothetical protein